MVDGSATALHAYANDRVKRVYLGEKPAAKTR